MHFRMMVVGFLAMFMWSATHLGVAMAQAPTPIALVEAEWLRDNLKNPNIRIVDVSNKADTYGKGHIPGAVQVRRALDLGDPTKAPPHLYPTKEQFEKLMVRLGINPGTTVVAYDDSVSLFASRLLVIMEMYGHDTGKLKLLNGGSVRWQALGYPMGTTPVTPPATSYKVSRMYLDRFVSWDEIYRDVVLGDKPEIMLLDSRPAAEYKAQNIRSIRGGYIPKAINVTGADAMAADQRFKSLDQIKKMYADAGFTPDKSIYEYCHSGDRSAHAYIILKHLLGYQNVRFNDGGWLEWSTILSLPAEGQVWLWDAPKK
jgi:thiosulfate/3-mercaptopyruvate sulfurtransferase